MSARTPVKHRPTRAKPEPEPRVHIIKDGSIEAVAEYINQGKAKNIIVMSGAGISTAAGIKDFRSPGTGLYDDLEKYNLPYPEAVFDISFFKDNPGPFYRLAKELYPGRYRPTLTHYLLPLLAKKNLLLRSYTQNIDMLERLTGLDEELLVEAHGSFASSKCIQCSVACESEWVKKHVLKSTIPYCKRCGGLVKFDITFFGEDLPKRFSKMVPVDFKKCDLLIVLGTSLLVEPFNRLITKVPLRCPRLLINREKAGEDMHAGFDFDDKWKYTIQRDALFLGNCDEGVKRLANLCGWEEDLQAMYEAGNTQMQLQEEMEVLVLKEQVAADAAALDIVHASSDSEESEQETSDGDVEEKQHEKKENKSTIDTKEEEVIVITPSTTTTTTTTTSSTTSSSKSANPTSSKKESTAQSSDTLEEITDRFEKSTDLGQTDNPKESVLVSSTSTKDA